MILRKPPRNVFEFAGKGVGGVGWGGGWGGGLDISLYKKKALDDLSVYIYSCGKWQPQTREYK